MLCFIIYEPRWINPVKKHLTEFDDSYFMTHWTQSMILPQEIDPKQHLIDVFRSKTSATWLIPNDLLHFFFNFTLTRFFGLGMAHTVWVKVGSGILINRLKSANLAKKWEKSRSRDRYLMNERSSHDHFLIIHWHHNTGKKYFYRYM